MKNLFVMLFAFFMIMNTSMAQQAQLMVRSGDKGLYLDHSVAPKEGLFAIGRKYNVNPKFLASYNNLDINKGLNIGQVLHIPLTDTNFSQKANKGTPVYYTVGEKEGLLKVSNANNKVTMQSLRQWNKLSNDNVPAGSKLIVGFLIPGENSVVSAPNPPKEELKKQTEKPAVKTDTTKSVVKEEVKKAEDKQPITPAPVVDKPVVKEEVKNTVPPEEKPKEETPKTISVPVTQEASSNTTNQGYFKPAFDQQVKQHPVSKTETVTSGIFKTSNGMQEAKYYLLIDAVSPGTIVRVINPENNKTIYAKVLGAMSGIRQNQGLNIRISNIAASTLGITDTEKFIVKVNY